MYITTKTHTLIILTLIGLIVQACQMPQSDSIPIEPSLAPPNVQISEKPDESTDLSIQQQATSPIVSSTKEKYIPSQFDTYKTWNGDTLPIISRRFNINYELLQKANPNLHKTDHLKKNVIVILPEISINTNPKPFLIIPDSEAIYGPGQLNLNIEEEVKKYSQGWLWQIEAGNEYLLPGWQIVHNIAMEYSVNPRILLALIEYQSGLISGTTTTNSIIQYPLNVQEWKFAKLPNQLMWAAEQLNNGYYGWRHGRLKELKLAENEIYQLHPHLNAGTVAIYSFFSSLYSEPLFKKAIGPDGFSATYKQLFGDPFQYQIDIIQPGLSQPTIDLPFEPGVIWNYTGGPHNAWRDSGPWAAIDFAPQLAEPGCTESNDWIIAPADGIITRMGTGVVAQNLDNDGSELTGWTLIYAHLLPEKYKLRVGKIIQKGERLGRPSCEGELETTGTHLHFARKYNGEWIPADGPPIFQLDKWHVIGEHRPYRGKLLNSETGISLVACACVNNNQISTTP